MEPSLRPWLELAVLQHGNLESALAEILAHKLASSEIPAYSWRSAIHDVLINCPPSSPSSPNQKKHLLKNNNQQQQQQAEFVGEGEKEEQDEGGEALAPTLKPSASTASFAASALGAKQTAFAWPPIEGLYELPTLLRADLMAVNSSCSTTLPPNHTLNQSQS